MPKFLINKTHGVDHHGVDLGRVLEFPKLGLRFPPGVPVEVTDPQLEEMESSPVSKTWFAAGDLVEWQEPTALAAVREESEGEEV